MTLWFRILTVLVLVVVGSTAITSLLPDRGAAESAKVTFSSTDWPWWRGLERNGIAAPGQNPPTEWNATKNGVWSTPIPGRGHSSPTVVGDQVVLATADESAGTQSVLCFDRRTGKRCLLYNSPGQRA